MKFKVAIALGLACLTVICSARPADDYDYEDGAAAPAAPAKPRSPLLNRRSPLSRPGPAAKSTTTTAAPELEEEEIPEEELVEEEVQPETSSTTESSRLLKGGIVRPFRSNQDLLATLKKRREQAVINKSQAKANGSDAEESAPVASEAEKQSKGRPSGGARGRYNKKESAAAAAPEEEGAPSTAATRTGARRFRN